MHRRRRRLHPAPRNESLAMTAGTMTAGTPLPADTVRHDESAARFSTTVEGQLCVLDYTLAGQVMTIVYTGVPKPVAGRGIAASLMRAALHCARERHWTVRAQCSYAVAYLRKQASAVADGHP